MTHPNSTSPVLELETETPEGKNGELSQPTQPVVSGVEWLDRMNLFRSLSGLDPVTENTEWSYGAFLHSKYLVKENVYGHYEDPSSPWFTPEGEVAGRTGNVTGAGSDVQCIDWWMAAPFHGSQMINPRQVQSGFGRYAETISGILRAAATLPLHMEGGKDLTKRVSFPVVWPGDGATLPVTSYRGGELPDPLSGSGYSASYNSPTGHPIYLILGDGGITPNVTDSSLLSNDVELAHFTFDETNYTNPDPEAQSLARSILDIQDAVVLMPREPLVVGQTYTVNIEVSGKDYTWSFNVA